MKVFKQVGELVMIVVSIVLLTIVNSKVDRRDTSLYPLRRRRALIVIAIIGLSFFIAAKLDVPQRLSSTDLEVVKHKAFQRTVCRSALVGNDYARADTATRHNKLSHRRALEAYKNMTRHTLDDIVKQLTNPVFFGVGCMISVAPFLPLLVAHIFFPSSRLPNEFWALVLPMINTVMACTTVVFVYFHFVVDASRTERCLLTSGHWYTYVLSTICCVYVLNHFATYRPQGLLTLWYVAWFALYQAFAIRVLTTTQKYYHDNDEAVDGILSALKVVPFMAIAAWLMDYRARAVATSSAAPPSSTPTATPSLSTPSAQAAVSSSATPPPPPPSATKEDVNPTPFLNIPPPPGPLDSQASSSSSSSSSSFAPPPPAPPLDDDSSSTPASSPPPTGLAAELQAGRGTLRRTSVNKSQSSSASSTSNDAKQSSSSSSSHNRSSSSSSGGPDIMAEMQRKMKQRRAAVATPNNNNNDDSDWT